MKGLETWQIMAAFLIGLVIGGIVVYSAYPRIVTEEVEVPGAPADCLEITCPSCPECPVVTTTTSTTTTTTTTTLPDSETTTTTTTLPVAEGTVSWEAQGQCAFSPGAGKYCFAVYARDGSMIGEERCKEFSKSGSTHISQMSIRKCAIWPQA